MGDRPPLVVPVRPLWWRAPVLVGGGPFPLVGISLGTPSVPAGGHPARGPMVFGEFCIWAPFSLNRLAFSSVRSHVVFVGS